MEWIPANVRAQATTLCHKIVHFQKAQFAILHFVILKVAWSSSIIIPAVNGNGITYEKFQEQTQVLNVFQIGPKTGISWKSDFVNE